MQVTFPSRPARMPQHSLGASSLAWRTISSRWRRLSDSISPNYNSIGAENHLDYLVVVHGGIAPLGAAGKGVIGAGHHLNPVREMGEDSIVEEKDRNLVAQPFLLLG